MTSAWQMTHRVLSAAAAISLSACCCFSVSDKVYQAHMKTAFSPGASTASWDALDSQFRSQLAAVFKALRRRGYHPALVSTYRSPRRQEMMYNYARTKEFFGAQPGTRARGGESCHNHRSPKGRFAALAADVVPGKGDRHDVRSRARFYWALGKAAKQQGLIWGGSWAKTHPTWRKYGLGWDPAHIQSRRCTWKLLKKDRETFSGES